MPMPVLEEKKLFSPTVNKLIADSNNNKSPNKNDIITKDVEIAPIKMSTAITATTPAIEKPVVNNNNANIKLADVTPVVPNASVSNQNRNNNAINKNGVNQNQNQQNKNNTNNSSNNLNNKPNNNYNNNQKNNQNNNFNKNQSYNNNNKNNQINNNNRNDKPNNKSYSNQNGSNNNNNNNESSNKYESREYKQQLQLNQSQAQSIADKKFTGRCRLFVGNLPLDITENEFKDIFSKYGETGEVFLNAQRSFGFIKLDTRINAEHAKQELDGFTFKGRCIRVRFASHGAAVRVKNLSPYVSNEHLEQSFSMFGPVERAVVIVDDKGRPTGEGIVEFERKPASVQCINKCSDMCFLLTSYPKPVVVEPLEQKDEEDGLPEKSIVRNAQYFTERETQARFAGNNSFEHKLSLKWRELYELEKQIMEEGKKRIDQAREMLEYEIEQALIDHKTMKLKEDLRAKQEELQRIEDMRKTEYQRRQDMEIRRHEEERRRQEDMSMMRKQDNMNQNSRNNNQNNGPVSMQTQFDPLLNQPHQTVLAQSNSSGQQQQSSGNNRRGGGGNNNNNNNNGPQLSNLGLVGGGQGLFDQNALQFQHTNQALQQLPPAQQQALIAAQLSFAMAAAAQQGQLGLFESPQMNINHNNHNNNNHGNKSGGKDDHRGSNNNNSRRQFERRGGNNNNRGGGRDDSYPGYDTKRARF